jgi:hypothetical protein
MHGKQPQQNSYRQDAREGGESPPLPRNCERFMPGCSSFRQDFSQGLFLVLEKIKEPLTVGQAACSWEGG